MPLRIRSARCTLSLSFEIDKQLAIGIHLFDAPQSRARADSANANVYWRCAHFAIARVERWEACRVSYIRGLENRSHGTTRDFNGDAALAELELGCWSGFGKLIE